jgi:hypothetical protein
MKLWFELTKTILGAEIVRLSDWSCKNCREIIREGKRIEIEYLFGTKCLEKSCIGCALGTCSFLSCLISNFSSTCIGTHRTMHGLISCTCTRWLVPCYKFQDIDCKPFAAFPSPVSLPSWKGYLVDRNNTDNIRHFEWVWHIHVIIFCYWLKSYLNWSCYLNHGYLNEM